MPFNWHMFIQIIKQLYIVNFLMTMVIRFIDKLNKKYNILTYNIGATKVLFLGDSFFFFFFVSHLYLICRSWKLDKYLGWLVKY